MRRELLEHAEFGRCDVDVRAAPVVADAATIEAFAPLVEHDRIGFERESPFRLAELCPRLGGIVSHERGLREDQAVVDL